VEEDFHQFEDISQQEQQEIEAKERPSASAEDQKVSKTTTKKSGDFGSGSNPFDVQHQGEDYEDNDNDDLYENNDEGGVQLDPFLENDWLRRELTTKKTPQRSQINVPTLKPAIVAFSSRPPRLRFTVEVGWTRYRGLKELARNDIWISHFC